MTIQRMIELLKIEHECILRNSDNNCDRKCADCDLVQDDKELHEMYIGVIAKLKEQEAREQCLKTKCVICPHCDNCDVDENGLLKEQVPVKPNLDVDEWMCGSCGHKLEYQELLNDNLLFHEQYNYCPNCGKKVNWNA